MGRAFSIAFQMLYEHAKKDREKSWILWKIFVAFCRRI